MLAYRFSIGEANERKGPDGHMSRSANQKWFVLEF